MNAVAPGLVNTPLTAEWTAAQELWREHSPMQRAASPEDIAQIVAMLVASDYLTGEIVIVDEGLNLTCVLRKGDHGHSTNRFPIFSANWT